MSASRQLAHQRQLIAQNRAAGAELHRRMPSITTPVANSRYTCPGYLFLDEYWYSYPDVAYPWDPAVLAAIRTFEPTAMPLTIRTVWRKGDYGNLGEPIVLTRHGIARNVRDPLAELHEFRCDMPIHPTRGLFASQPHALAKTPPNWFEVHYYNRDVREYSMDVTGQYLPMGWSFYNFLYETYENNRRAKDISDEYLQRIGMKKERAERADKDEKAYIDRDIERWIEKHTLSDVEHKEAAAYSAYSEPEKPITMTVPDMSQAHVGVTG